ncbi:MAG TPA: YtxH domain-containing protein [bacterium]|jgi:gas vesicle protein|nr:YtxH domain-containing protein [bacterium]
MESNSNTSASTVLLAILGGAVVGAGIALLYAPQSGHRTRQKLQDLADDAEGYANDLAGQAEAALSKAERKGEEWLKNGQDFVEDKKRQVAQAIDGSKSSR